MSEEDAQYLYSLTTMLDSCAHHALALGGLRELRCALADVPVEAVAASRVARWNARANFYRREIRDYRLRRLGKRPWASSRSVRWRYTANWLTRLERALGGAKARPPSPNSPITESHLDDERRRHGPRTRVLPMAHEFMTRAIPAMADPAPRRAIRTIRLLCR